LLSRLGAVTVRVVAGGVGNVEADAAVEKIPLMACDNIFFNDNLFFANKGGKFDIVISKKTIA
jgi:hypothetical protein